MMRSSTTATAFPADLGSDLANDLESPGKNDQRPRLMFIASSPDHLTELLGLRGWWASRDRTWVAFDQADARSELAGEHVTWASWSATGGFRTLARSLRLALRVMRDDRPDMVVAAGEGVALPFILVARARRIPSVHVEVAGRAGACSLSGRLCRPLSSQSLVQWPEPADVSR